MDTKKLSMLISILVILSIPFVLAFAYNKILLPPISREKLDMKQTQVAFGQISKQIKVYDAQLEKNNKKLSGVDWGNYSLKKFKITDPYSAIKDYYVTSANQYIIDGLIPAYFASSSIKIKEFKDIRGAKIDFDSLEKILKENSYYSNQADVLKTIKMTRIKNGL